VASGVGVIEGERGAGASELTTGPAPAGVLRLAMAGVPPLSSRVRVFGPSCHPAAKWAMRSGLTSAATMLGQLKETSLASLALTTTVVSQAQRGELAAPIKEWLRNNPMAGGCNMLNGRRELVVHVKNFYAANFSKDPTGRWSLLTKTTSAYEDVRPAACGGPTAPPVLPAGADTLTSSSCLLIPILCTNGLVHAVARSALLWCRLLSGALYTS
jgi:hypothetical protein